MVETERKYIIKKIPDSILQKFAHYKKIKISQTYLQNTDGLTCRVRKTLTSDGKTAYIYNSKKRISPLSCVEDEYEITSSEYEKLLEKKESGTVTIEKIRQSFVFAGQLFEVDSYDFSDELCICETELENENQRAKFPDEIEIVHEVSGQKEFSNHSFAKLLFSGEKPF